jgi:hypothetical protein
LAEPLPNLRNGKESQDVFARRIDQDLFLSWRRRSPRANAANAIAKISCRLFALILVYLFVGGALLLLLVYPRLPKV